MMMSRYRSGDDLDLAARQTEMWDPWLGWAKQTRSLSLPATDGLMPVSPMTPQRGL